jgi:serine O-acetyltransferase
VRRDLDDEVVIVLDRVVTDPAAGFARSEEASTILRRTRRLANGLDGRLRVTLAVQSRRRIGLRGDLTRSRRACLYAIATVRDGKNAGYTLVHRRASAFALFFASAARGARFLQMHHDMKSIFRALARPSSSSDAEPSLWRLIKEDYEAHGRDASRPGFQALAVYRFGVARMKVGPKPVRAPLSVLYRALFRSVRNFYGIEIPYTAKVGRRVVFEHQHGIVIHGSSVIGDECVIRQGVTLGIRRLDALDEAPVLGNNVDVGCGAKILGRVHVGDGAAIGANAVVLDDVPEGQVAVGIPARVASRPVTGIQERPRLVSRL